MTALIVATEVAGEAPLKPAAAPDDPLGTARSGRSILTGLVLLVCLSILAFAFAPLPGVAPLYAIPVAELVVTPELEVKDDAQQITAQQDLFADLFPAGQVFGAPSERLAAPTDFQPSAARASSSPLPPPPQPPPPQPPSPHPPPSPKPWLAEAMRPPRPVNVSHAKPDGAPGRWSYAVKDVRPGTVLLANRPFGREKSYFDGAAVLLVKVCGCHPSIFGLILSEPSAQKMASAFCPVATARYPDFANSSVRLGGPVGPHWSLLHSRADVGAQRLQPGLSVGGSLSELEDLVQGGAVSPDDVLFYSGYAAWPIERLQQEVAAGQWSVAKASASLLLEAARGGGARDAISLAMAK